MKWIKRIAWVMFLVGYMILMAWMIDKDVSGDMEKWEGQTTGMASPRVSDAD